MQGDGRIWDWEIRGFARIVILLQQHHFDRNASPCPPECLRDLADHVQILQSIIDEQRAKANEGACRK